MADAAEGTNQNKELMFRQKTNHPIEISHGAMYDQKVSYRHTNPVEEGLVTLPEHYAWSSAHPYGPLCMFEE